MDYTSDNRFILYDKILELQDRIDKLEKLNSEKDNALNELENRLMDKIYKIQPVVYNLKSKDD